MKTSAVSSEILTHSSDDWPLRYLNIILLFLQHSKNIKGCCIFFMKLVKISNGKEGNITPPPRASGLQACVKLPLAGLKTRVNPSPCGGGSWTILCYRVIKKYNEKLQERIALIESIQLDFLRNSLWKWETNQWLGSPPPLLQMEDIPLHPVL